MFENFQTMKTHQIYGSRAGATKADSTIAPQFTQIADHVHRKRWLKQFHLRSEWELERL